MVNRKMSYEKTLLPLSAIIILKTDKQIENNNNNLSHDLVLGRQF